MLGIAEALEAYAPLRFARTLKALGVQANLIEYLKECRADDARRLIAMMVGDKAHKQAVLDAYELYLAEAGRVVYRLNPKSKGS